MAAPLVIVGVAKPPELIITELQTAGATASQEFIEIYNPGVTDIDLAGATGGTAAWRLHFFSASTTASGSPVWSQPTYSLPLTGTVPAGEYYLLASKEYLPGDVEADQDFSDRMSNTGGGLQLVQADGKAFIVHDRIVWQAGSTRAAGTWQTPEPGGSMQREPIDDSYLLEDGTPTAFRNEGTITPGDAWVQNPGINLPEEPGGEEGASPVPPETVPAPPVNSSLAAPVISELLPNPASPARDESDEYIELFNPNQEPFILTGYTLEVGSTRLHDFTFTDATIPARQYIALYSNDTELPLANSGGQARLLDPQGAKLTEAAPYTAAKDGLAWAANGQTWEWTTTPTPGMPNSISVLASSVGSPGSAKTSQTAARVNAAKVSGVKGVRTKAKTSKPKTARTKAAKVKKQPKQKPAQVASITKTEAPRPTIHTGILVAVAGLAVLYGAYEYRHDVADRIRRLRGHRAARVRTGRQAARR